jgi:rubrerythrin
MQATVPGQNRTGAAVSAQGVELMLKAVDELSPPGEIDTSQMEIERQTYIADSDAVGSIPGAGTDRQARGAKRQGQAEGLSVFLDKLGERLAFERTGTRLYDALIVKYRALLDAGLEPLPPDQSDLIDVDLDESDEDDLAARMLDRIRADELEHFHLVAGCIARLGGDPTAQTPCADVSAAASIGLMQVVTDPRTTLAQSLNAMLTAELTDTAGWELLAELAEEAGHKEMASTFLQSLEVEQGHVAVVRGWLRSLLSRDAGTPAV